MVTGLIKCQEACTDARLFNCRSFAFSSSFSSSFNCYLSDREASNLDTGLDLVRDFDSVVYGRSSYCNGGGYNRGRAEGKNLPHKLKLRVAYFIGMFYIIEVDEGPKI